MSQNSGSEVGDFPDYQDSEQNRMQLQNTLQLLDGMLSNSMNLERKDRFKKKRLVKKRDQNKLSLRAIPHNETNATLGNLTLDNFTA